MAITQAFGIREVCHCVFTPEDTINNTEFIIDTAKMSSMEGSSTTVYAQGGSGNARLIAWEGEKTMTFTVEDALLTMESFAALTGAKLNNNIFRIYPHSFAGYYSITALTLVRTEDGIDHLATIKIPRAKLQTTLNLSMAPSGDPSSFSFTFDVFPKRNGEGDEANLMCEIQIDDDTFTGTLSERIENATDTTVWIDGIKYVSTATEPKITITKAASATAAATISLNNADKTVTATLQAGEIFTNLSGSDYSHSTTENYEIALRKGSTTRWYAI